MIREFINSEIFRISAVIIFKIIICVILVGAIGYNREKKGMVVGISTHVMVGLVGLLIQITSLEYYRINGGDNDVFRLAGQYISGIGFLGAGTILKDKRSVKGLTTAASICLAAIIGLAVGTGIYLASIVVTLVAYAFLNDVPGWYDPLMGVIRGTYHNVYRDNCKFIPPESMLYAIRKSLRQKGVDTTYISNDMLGQIYANALSDSKYSIDFDEDADMKIYR